MDLDTQLAELLASMGVVMEAAQPPDPDPPDPQPHTQADSQTESDAMIDDGDVSGEDTSLSELCLFQTSREHYGVFYRLDLIAGAPQLRVFLPDELSPVKMRCYLVRATACSPLREWFTAAERYDGSLVYEDARDSTQQHLLFAAGELMKRLFWAGELEEQRFPPDVEVRRLV